MTRFVRLGIALLIVAALGWAVGQAALDGANNATLYVVGTSVAGLCGLAGLALLLVGLVRRT